MTKTYCDLCGKEIENPTITLTIEFHKEEDESWMNPGWKDFDICSECKDRAIEFFKRVQEDE